MHLHYKYYNIPSNKKHSIEIITKLIVQKGISYVLTVLVLSIAWFKVDILFAKYIFLYYFMTLNPSVLYSKFLNPFCTNIDF